MFFSSRGKGVKSVFFSLVMMVSMSVTAFAKTIPLKPGQYKVTTTATMLGPAAESMAQMKKQLETLPKAAQEQALKQLKNIQPTSQTKESIQCLTNDDLNYDLFIKSLNKDNDCKITNNKKSAKEFSTKTICKNGGQTNMSIKVLNDKSYSFEGEGMHGGKVLTQFKGTGAWSSAKCAKK